MINFDTIDNEVLTESKDLIIKDNDSFIYETTDLTYFIEASENFNVVSKQTANTCLSMTLQARKIRQSLDKARLEAVKPYQKQIKFINSQAKDFEKKLEEIEKSLSDKILEWLENPEEFETEKMSVDDGSLTKKVKRYFDLLDIDSVPREYLKIDEKKVEEAIKNGIAHIPGIGIYSRNEIDLRLKNT